MKRVSMIPLVVLMGVVANIDQAAYAQTPRRERLAEEQQPPAGRGWGSRPAEEAFPCRVPSAEASGNARPGRPGNSRARRT